MIRDEIMKLKGKALREAVCEQVMGRARDTNNQGGIALYLWRDSGGYYIADDRFEPELNMADAWRVVEKMRDYGFEYVSCRTDWTIPSGPIHSCYIELNPRHTYLASAPIMPVAICRAALLAIQEKEA